MGRTRRGHGRQGQRVRCRGFQRHVNVRVDQRFGLGQGGMQERMELGGLGSSHGRGAGGEAVDAAMLGRRGDGRHGGRGRGRSFPKHVGHGGVRRDGQRAGELELPHAVFEVLDIVPDGGWRGGRDGRSGAFPVMHRRPPAVIDGGFGERRGVMMTVGRVGQVGLPVRPRRRAGRNITEGLPVAMRRGLLRRCLSRRPASHP